MKNGNSNDYFAYLLQQHFSIMNQFTYRAAVTDTFMVCVCNNCDLRRQENEDGESKDQQSKKPCPGFPVCQTVFYVVKHIAHVLHKGFVSYPAVSVFALQTNP